MPSSFVGRFHPFGDLADVTRVVHGYPYQVRTELTDSAVVAYTEPTGPAACGYINEQPVLADKLPPGHYTSCKTCFGVVVHLEVKGPDAPPIIDIK